MCIASGAARNDVRPWVVHFEDQAYRPRNIVVPCTYSSHNDDSDSFGGNIIMCILYIYFSLYLYIVLAVFGYEALADFINIT